MFAPLDCIWGIVMKRFLDNEQKSRLVFLMKHCAIYLSVGIAYYIFVFVFDKRIPCLLTLLTGGYCPGCGITRMFMSLFRGDIVSAFRYNQLVMVVLPFAVFFGIRRGIKYVKYEQIDGDLPEKIFIIVVFAFTVVFWILRNIETFGGLRPPG